MDTKASLPAPYFDPQQVRSELTELFKKNGTADAARSDVLERLKQLVETAHATAFEDLKRDRNGRKCANGLAQFQDELVGLLLDYTTTHVYRATNPSDAERMSVIATGGYGRDLLAPGSDIDLLFLFPYKQTPWGESVTEYMLYLLWDLGFKVGHATRTVNQCIKLAREDITIRTALLDMWLIHGDEELFAKLEKRFRKDVISGSERLFIDAKMEERDERHKRSGESRYHVEPNIKDGKGGLRDLHTLHWISKYLTDRSVGEEAVEEGIYTNAEMATFRRCEDFLWTVRCFLHFMTGRAEERLTFDLQPPLAEALGYKSRRGLKAVERFMKHYFLIAKDVGDLTTILCSALEIQQLKSAPSVNQMLNPLNWRTRRQIRNRTDFRIDNDRLNVANDKVFEADPVNLIRFFSNAEATHTFLHPDAIRLLRRSLHLIDDNLRADKEANRIFVELITNREHPAAILSRMNDAGVLGRFIPDFGTIVGMTQFNMYHHYTVDEHLLRTLAMVNDIEKGGVEDEAPLSSEIIGTIKNRRVLLLAAFLHDIGKGRDEDHSVVGARVARELCPRLGFDEAETELVAWLIEEHLTMSNTAQSRDIADPKTISDFAQIVGNIERLNLLLLLTVADIRAVGPGVWNGWKGQLLRSLYFETKSFLEKGGTTESRSQLINEAQEMLREALSGWTDDELQAVIDLHYPEYWLRTDPEKQIVHAHLLRRAQKEDLKFATSFSTDDFTSITELTVFALNHPRLLSLFAGACAANGANIVGAHIATTRDGFAVDSFVLAREFPTDDDEIRRAGQIGETITGVLKGERRLGDMLAQRRRKTSRAEAFTVESKVSIDNTISDDFTVIEVEGLDRPGLLYGLTSALSDLSLDINSAHIATFGEKAVDVFYLTDLTGKKIVSSDRQAKIEQHLRDVLDG